MLNILHITGHLGGGVGTVVLSYLVGKKSDATQHHRLLSLDYLNEQAKAILSSHGTEHYERCHARADFVNACIAEADVVLLHWWNHPLISDLLIRRQLAKCRLVLWSHISGSPAPNNFTRKLFSYPDAFVFTTPLSYFDPVYVDLPKHDQESISTIWSTAGVERLENLEPQPHEGFNIGYVGSLDFTKIHPDFVRICELVDIPEARFTVIGPINPELVLQASRSPIAGRIRFTGFISEEEKWAELSRFDVFGYPLAPHHYATCDQTLQEAMAVGIVPIVLNNPMESYMVRHGEVGLIARSIEGYVQSIERLYKDTAFKAQLSVRARKYAKKEYSLRRMSGDWDALFLRIMDTIKSEKVWPRDSNSLFREPYQMFIESLGNHAGIFQDHIEGKHFSRQVVEAQLQALGTQANWRSPNKSSVHQFAHFFPEDSRLQHWSRLMNGAEVAQDD